MPNAGHIILPLSTELRLQAEMEEYDRNKRIWKRPTVESRRKVGRVLEITNTPVIDKGKLKNFNPLQVACLALQHARRSGFDVIRVKTPGLEKDPTEKLLADMDFSVQYLCRMHEEDELFFPQVRDGKIKISDNEESAALNDFPETWRIDPANGTFAPRG